MHRILLLILLGFSLVAFIAALDLISERARFEITAAPAGSKAAVVQSLFADYERITRINFRDASARTAALNEFQANYSPYRDAVRRAGELHRVALVSSGTSDSDVEDVSIGIPSVLRTELEQRTQIHKTTLGQLALQSYDAGVFSSLQSMFVRADAELKNEILDAVSRIGANALSRNNYNSLVAWLKGLVQTNPDEQIRKTASATFVAMRPLRDISLLTSIFQSLSSDQQEQALMNIDAFTPAGFSFLEEMLHNGNVRLKALANQMIGLHFDHPYNTYTDANFQKLKARFDALKISGSYTPSPVANATMAAASTDDPQFLAQVGSLPNRPNSCTPVPTSAHTDNDQGTLDLAVDDVLPRGTERETEWGEAVPVTVSASAVDRPNYPLNVGVYLSDVSNIPGSLSNAEVGYNLPDVCLGTVEDLGGTDQCWMEDSNHPPMMIAIPTTRDGVARRFRCQRGLMFREPINPGESKTCTAYLFTYDGAAKAAVNAWMDDVGEIGISWPRDTDGEGIPDRMEEQSSIELIKGDPATITTLDYCSRETFPGIPDANFDEDFDWNAINVNRGMRHDENGDGFLAIEEYRGWVNVWSPRAYHPNGGSVLLGQRMNEISTPSPRTRGFDPATVGLKQLFLSIQPSSSPTPTTDRYMPDPFYQGDQTLVTKIGVQPVIVDRGQYDPMAQVFPINDRTDLCGTVNLFNQPAFTGWPTRPQSCVLVRPATSAEDGNFRAKTIGLGRFAVNDYVSGLHVFSLPILFSPIAMLHDINLYQSSVTTPVFRREEMIQQVLDHEMDHKIFNVDHFEKQLTRSTNPPILYSEHDNVMNDWVANQQRRGPNYDKFYLVYKANSGNAHLTDVYFGYWWRADLLSATPLTPYILGEQWNGGSVTEGFVPFIYARDDNMRIEVFYINLKQAGMDLNSVPPPADRTITVHPTSGALGWSPPAGRYNEAGPPSGIYSEYTIQDPAAYFRGDVKRIGFVAPIP